MKWNRALMLLLAVAVAGTSAVAATELALTGEDCRWEARASHGMPITLVRSGETFVVDASPDGGEESFPHLRTGFREARDWRMFDRLCFEVRLRSDAPDIQANGKELAFCIYDNGLRHTALDGNPPVQQLFARARVKAGEEWQPIEVDLTGAVRGGVTGLDIHLYEAPYSYAHQYHFEFRKLRLEGKDPGLVVWDGVTMTPEEMTAAAGTPQETAAMVTLANGFTLAFGAGGGITGIRNGGESWSEVPAGFGGVWVRDAGNAALPFRHTGTPVADADGVTQTAEWPEAALAMTVHYRPEGDAIRVSGEIRSLNALDRAVGVYLALPLNPAADYDFYSSLSRSIKPFREMEKVPQFEAKVTDYPFTVAAAPAQRQALAIAVDQGKPCNYRLAVNPKLGILYAAADFALIDETDVDGRSMRGAAFDFLVYPADPAWGMRSAAERYYRHFPEYYADRVKSGGGWEIPWHANQSQQNPEETLAGGYRFVWGADELDAENWSWNAANGRLNLIYIEPEFFQFSMGDYASPTAAETLERMRKLSGGDAAEWEKFLPLHYSRAYNCNPHASNSDRREFLHGLIEAAFASGMYDRGGEPVLGLGNRVAWIGDSGFGAMIPCNLAPAIPAGRGEAAIAVALDPLIREIQGRGLPLPNGFGLDCFMDVPADYRRENFRYNRLPLTFDAQTRQPMVQRGFGSIEWLRELAARYRPDGMVVMANAFGPITFAAPDLDIFGIENTFVTDPEFLRTIAGPFKPTTYLPYEPQEKAKIEYHMFWGIYPGRNVTVDILGPMIPVLDRLYAAGWEPVTAATADGVRLERFGRAADGEIFFTVHNPGATAAKAAIRPDHERLGGVGGWSAETVYPEQRPLPVLELELAAGATAVIRIFR